jgi:RNA polymerase sigma-70 factor (ECF subfamily)
VSASRGTITHLLLQWSQGNRSALDKLIPLVYRELHRLARHYLRRQSPDHTLQTSALINEAYLRLIDHKNMAWQNRAHFYGVAAQAMRRILVDYARNRHAAKRGGGAVEVSLDKATVVAREQAAELIALDDALRDLAAISPRKSQIVELRYFGGLSVEETAEVLGISTATVVREWRSARRLLLRALAHTESDDTRATETGR